MQNSHPENIDDLERFYQEQLGDLDIEPPAEVWDRISSKIGKPKKPFFKSSGFIVGITAILFTTVTILLVQWQKADQKELEEHKQEGIPFTPLDSLQPGTETKEIKETFTAPKTVEKKTGLKSTTKTTRVKTTEKVMTADTVKNTETVTTPVDIGKEVNTEKSTETVIPDKEKTPVKKPKSFYDAQKEQYRDSTRQLFVPNK